MAARSARPGSPPLDMFHLWPLLPRSSSNNPESTETCGSSCYGENAQSSKSGRGRGRGRGRWGGRGGALRGLVAGAVGEEGQSRGDLCQVQPTSSSSSISEDPTTPSNMTRTYAQKHLYSFDFFGWIFRHPLTQPKQFDTLQINSCTLSLSFNTYAHLSNIVRNILSTNIRFWHFYFHLQRGDEHESWQEHFPLRPRSSSPILQKRKGVWCSQWTDPFLYPTSNPFASWRGTWGKMSSDVHSCPHIF